MRVVKLRKEEPYLLKKFLDLPQKIYSPKELTNNRGEEESILTGKHILSSKFSVEGFLVLDSKDNPLSRAIVSIYPNSEHVYIGFFESVQNEKAAQILFEHVEEYVKGKGISKIIGPVDGSFWIKYRLKVNRFHIPYTGEPYNKGYYLEMFQKAGYKVSKKYISNNYMVIPKEHKNPLLERRLRETLKKGYEIKSPEKGEFKKILEETYPLLIELYSTFPIFAEISQDEFVENFAKLMPILDFSMIKMAYYEGKLVGFVVVLPNYGHILSGKMTLIKALNILKFRKKAKEYVILYLGADSKHLGLGGALVQVIKDKLAQRSARSIGALIQEGKVSATYFDELICGTYEYVLLEKDLKKV